MSSVTLEKCILEMLKENGIGAFKNVKQFRSGLKDTSQGNLKDELLLSSIINEPFLRCYEGELSDKTSVDRATERAYQYIRNHYPVTEEWARNVADSFRNAINSYFGYGSKRTTSFSDASTKNRKLEKTDENQPLKNMFSMSSVRKQELAENEESKVYQLFRSARNDNVRAQFQLANCYLNGNGVEKNSKKGMDWLKEAAENGYVPAQLKLGKIYYKGNEVTDSDKGMAAHWLEKAAEGRDPVAQYELGKMYYYGDGIPQNEAEGLLWLRESSKNGNNRARDLYDNLVQSQKEPIRSADTSTSTSEVFIVPSDSGEKKPKPKRMKKILWSIMCVVAAYVVGFLLPDIMVKDMQDSKVSTPSTVEDVYSVEEQYRASDDEFLKEYFIFYYGEDTETLQEYIDELHIYKSSGYTLEDVQNYNLDNVAPGVNDLSFVTKEVEDCGDYIALIIRVTHMDNVANAKKAIDTGIFELEDESSSLISRIDGPKTIKNMIEGMGLEEVTDPEEKQSLHKSKTLSVKS